ncbi:MAG: redoxin domain-containing protein [Chitinophagaceae bacterium]
MPRLFLSAMIVAACVSLPAIKNLNTPADNLLKLHKSCIQTQQLNDTVFSLTGKILGLKKGIIKLIYTDKNGKYIHDSSAIKKGRFKFRGYIAEPTMVYLDGTIQASDMNDPNFTSFFLDPADVKITLVFNDFKNAIITGSKTQDEHMAYNQSIAPVLKEMEPISKEYESAARDYRNAVKAKKEGTITEQLKNKAEEIREKFDPYTVQIRKIEYDFFSRNPQSYVTAFQLRFHAGYLPVDSLQYFYDKLGTKIQQSSSGKVIAKEIEQLRRGSPGSIAKDFTATDLLGNRLSLSDYKGKYVLLDFWASWCIPCRKGNPHLRKLYLKYKDMGIEFIGIADDDQSEDKWKQAITKDDIGIWKHVLRGLKYKNNSFDGSTDISEKFGIHSLPTKILIDPEGKIIGRYSEDEGPLDEMLKKIFGE